MPKVKSVKQQKAEQKDKEVEKEKLTKKKKQSHYKTPAAVKKQREEQRANGPNPLQLPISERDLVACRECHRSMTSGQFIADGCVGCDGADQDRMTRDEMQESTTTQFSGHVGILDTNRSWIARLIGVAGKPPGVYAARVNLPKHSGGDGSKTKLRNVD